MPKTKHTKTRHPKTKYPKKICIIYTVSDDFVVHSEEEEEEKNEEMIEKLMDSGFQHFDHFGTEVIQ